MLPAALPPSPGGQPAPLNPVPRQQRGEHNLGKAAAAKALCVCIIFGTGILRGFILLSSFSLIFSIMQSIILSIVVSGLTRTL